MGSSINLRRFEIINFKHLENILNVEACDDATALSKLTDDWINQTIRNSSDPGLEKARQILKRIDDRDKYK